MTSSAIPSVATCRSSGHPGDVEQELPDLPGLRIVTVILHLDAPLPYGTVSGLSEDNVETVSYTHLTLPTIYSV